MSVLQTRLARVTSIYAFCHFAVDLACIYTVTGTIAPAMDAMGVDALALAILVYDMVAFCMQLPIGAFLDAVTPGRWGSAAQASFALTAAGCALAFAGGVASAVSVLLVALGNALFHCVGGEEVLGESSGAAAPSGLFISTGAAGVFIGGLAAFQGWRLSIAAILALLALSALLVFRLDPSDEMADPDWTIPRTGWIAIAFLAATVALRSYTGMVMAFPWKADIALAAAAVCAVVAGKAVGGLLADRIGSVGAAFVSLGASAPIFLFSWDHVAAGLAATLLFNFTMAITLSALANLIPRGKGFAFGIASFSLAIGALPALLGARASSPALLCALSAISLALLLAGLHFAKRPDGTPVQ